MLHQFTRDQPLEPPTDPLRDVNTAPTRSRVDKLLCAKHPATLAYLSQLRKCVQCGFHVTLCESIGQRQCAVHAKHYLALVGKWECCGARGENAAGCVPADHSPEKRGVRDAWVVPSWFPMANAPLRHTVVPPASVALHTPVSLRRTSDHKTPEEERAYAHWESNPDNYRLVSTNDALRICFLPPLSSLPDAPATPTRTTLSDVLAASGPIMRRMC